MLRFQLATLALLSFLADQAVAGRVALVIGNDTYANIAPLKNARADAAAIAKALEDAGFRVTLKRDLNQKEMTRALREFRGSIAGGDDAVFFYAGHGAQIAGANYLLPTDLNGEDEAQVRDDAVPLQRVLDDLQEQKARFMLAIIDACRDNPFKGRGRSIGARGLAPTSAADGQMVIFSAGAGQQALDHLGPNDMDPNGLFTRVFVKEIAKPDVAVHEAMRNVRDEVVKFASKANHRQTPAIYDQSTGKFYFRRGSGAQREATIEAAAVDMTPAIALQTDSRFAQLIDVLKSPRARKEKVALITRDIMKLGEEDRELINATLDLHYDVSYRSATAVAATPSGKYVVGRSWRWGKQEAADDRAIEECRKKVVDKSEFGECRIVMRSREIDLANAIALIERAGSADFFEWVSQIVETARDHRQAAVWMRY